MCWKERNERYRSGSLIISIHGGTQRNTVDSSQTRGRSALLCHRIRLSLDGFSNGFLGQKGILPSPSFGIFYLQSFMDVVAVAGFIADGERNLIIGFVYTSDKPFLINGTNLSSAPYGWLRLFRRGGYRRAKISLGRLSPRYSNIAERPGS